MRFVLMPLLLCAAALPSFAHDHGCGMERWPHRSHAFAMERRGYGWDAPRCYARRPWRAYPRPVWIEPEPECRVYGAPVLRFEVNLR